MVFLVLFCSMFEMLISLVYFLFNLATVIPRFLGKSKRMAARPMEEQDEPILLHLLADEEESKGYNQLDDEERGDRKIRQTVGFTLRK
jgi:hypothetical protein